MLAISPAHNEARLGGTLAFLDAGAGAAKIRVYKGARPADAQSAATSLNLLVEITLSKPAGAVAGGILALTQAEDGLIVATGEASWARVVNGAGVVAFDADCSDAFGSGDIRLPSLNLLAGGSCRLISAVMG